MGDFIVKTPLMIIISLSLTILQFIMYWLIPVFMVVFGFYMMLFYQVPEDMLEDFGTKGIIIVSALIIMLGISMYRPSKIKRNV